MSEPKVARNYFGGKWVRSSDEKLLEVENPSTGEVIGRVVLSSAADVDRAVEAARGAFGPWSRTPLPGRVSSLYALRGLLLDHQEKISRTLCAEMGKSLPDARAEMNRTVQNVEAACGMPILQHGDKMIGSAAGIDGEVIRLPLGVFAAMTPFNFPAMAPFWFLPYALATGNTFVLKPSEQVPLTMALIADLLDQTGLPPGVFNLVNGDKAAAEALVDHPGVRGVSFVGKSSTCRAVASRCVALNKRCQAMGSAKNHLVVMPDFSKLDQLIRNMSTSCFGCAGQRCMASSAIVAIGDETYQAVTERFVEDSKRFLVANPFDPSVADEPMLMGPVISADAKRFIVDMIARGVAEGATLALDGRDAVIPGGENGHFLGPTVFTDVKPGMEIHRTELFGPVVVILKAASLDGAISIINEHQYANACSIYTQSGHYARKFKLEAECGIIGVNVGIPAPVPFLPFGGMNDSMVGDVKMQGKAAVSFFAADKVIVERFGFGEW